MCARPASRHRKKAILHVIRLRLLSGFDWWWTKMFVCHIHSHTFIADMNNISFMTESFGGLFEIVSHIVSWWCSSCRRSTVRCDHRWRIYLVNEMWPFFISYICRMTTAHAHTTHAVPYLSLRRLLHNNNNTIRTIWDELKATRKTWCCLRRQSNQMKGKEKRYLAT